MLIHDALITGSLLVNGTGYNTGSFSGSFIGEIEGVSATASYVEYTNIANKPALVSGSAQIEGFGIFATTGSNQFNGNQAITGSLTTTGTIVAQTLNVQQVTSSIVYSSGSNIFGNELGNTQQFTGSVGVTGSLTVAGAGTFSSSVTTNNLGFIATSGYGITSYSGATSTGDNITFGAGVFNTFDGIYQSSGATRDFGIWLNGGTINEPKFVVKNGGNVGIGTTGPNRLFEVSSGGDTGYIRVTGNRGNADGVHVGNLEFYNSNTSRLVGEVRGITGTGGTQSNSGQLAFYTNDNGTYAERMRITSGGSINFSGIDATTQYYFGYNRPTATNLLVNGTNNNKIRIQNVESDVVVLNSNGNSYFNGGNVGINTTDPTNLLHLTGASSTPSLRLGSISAGFHYDIGRENQTTGDFIINATVSGTLQGTYFRLAQSTGAATFSAGITTGAATNYLTNTSTGTNPVYQRILNTGGDIIFGIASSTGGSLLPGVGNYATVLYNNTNTNISFGTNQLLRMTIKSDGRVYVGSTSTITSDPLFGVIGSGVWDGGCISLSNTGTGGLTYTIFSTNSLFGQGAGNLLFYNNNNGSNNLIIYTNGNYDFLGSDVSDVRLKQDIENLNYGLTEIMQLSPKSYHLKSENNLQGENQTILRKRYGFIAQEIQQILPDTITGEETETDYLGLDYNGVLAVAVKAIQELKSELDAAKTEIQLLKQQ